MKIKIIPVLFFMLVSVRAFADGSECPKGFYGPDSAHCIRCPSFTTTADAGATSDEACVKPVKFKIQGQNDYWKWPDAIEHVSFNPNNIK